jgi:bifunctional UDP-N-acetylglucosamine pyrophosphorylase / glucosamine-1-phosphate N-acetyltransferase
MKLAVTILAAGQGSRMRSQLPKVLHPLAGRPLLSHVLSAARQLDPDSIHVVYGHGGDTVRARIPEADVQWVEQREQLGTGHAVNQVLPALSDDEAVLVLYGDVPLVQPSTLMPLVLAARGGALGLLTAHADDPSGYGRIVRDAEGRVRAIVEEKDADPTQRAITEINTGLLAAPVGRLRAWLGRLRNDNAQGEYYLTDIVAAAVEDGVEVQARSATDMIEILGVNDRSQLAQLERAYQWRSAQRLMQAGLSLADPARFDLRGELTVGRDCFVDVNTVFEGRVVLGDNVHIGPNCFVRDCEIGSGAHIHPNSVLEQALIGEQASVGPFARVRPGSDIRRRAKVGNFVEIKQAVLEEGAKVNHLSYIGDAEVGSNANIGAGTITCNYDGANKHRTVIGAGAFVGSGTNLVAPVSVGAGATIGAGSTVTKDAPAAQLTLSRARQTTVAGWKRPTKA